MPILYACVVNRRKEIVLDGQDKRFKSNYKELVLDNYRLFEPGKSKAFELGESFQLHYRHEGTWVIAIISQKPDVTLYEAMNFIDRFRAVIMPDEETGDGDIQAESAEEHFARHKGQVSDLIYKWNSDPSNRDRTYQVFQELLQTKEEMIKNMHLLNDRDQLLEVGLVKAQGLEKTTKLYKINAKKQKNKMITRRCCLWFGSITGIVVIAVGAFLLLWLVFGVIKL